LVQLEPTCQSPVDGAEAVACHLRLVPGLARFRQEAIDRAVECYHESRERDSRGATVEGSSLVVIQRAFIAAEDLGRLLYARSGQAHWKRLNGSTGNREALTEMYRKNADEYYQSRPVDYPAERGTVGSKRLAAFGFPGSVELGRWNLDSPLFSALLLALVEHDKWLRWAFDQVSVFWMAFASRGMASLHGFPFIAGAEMTLKEVETLLGGQQPETEPYVVGLRSQLENESRIIWTDSDVVDLSPARIDQVGRTGRVAAELSEIVARNWLRELGHGERTALPLRAELIQRLPATARDELRRFGFVP
jgi:hypothetical protein